MQCAHASRVARRPEPSLAFEIQTNIPHPTAFAQQRPPEKLTEKDGIPPSLWRRNDAVQKATMLQHDSNSASNPAGSGSSNAFLGECAERPIRAFRSALLGWSDDETGDHLTLRIEGPSAFVDELSRVGFEDLERARPRSTAPIDGDDRTRGALSFAANITARISRAIARSPRQQAGGRLESGGRAAG
jgi:hypothetical protein